MSQDSKFDFSTAIDELEEINHWFQNEEIDLDTGLSKFRKGLELIKKCRDRLKQVENEFVEIKKEFATEKNESEEVSELDKPPEEVIPDVDKIPF